MILDAGVLVAIDRSEAAAIRYLATAEAYRTALHTTHPVLAQVWRQGSRQVRLARALRSITVHPFDDGRSVGLLLARAGSADVVDAHLMVLATRLRDDVLTGDSGDLAALAAASGPLAPTVYSWPPG